MAEQKKWEVFCPLIQGICKNGWNRDKMGANADGEPIRCASWVRMRGPNTNTGEEMDEDGCWSYKWQLLVAMDQAKFSLQLNAELHQQTNMSFALLPLNQQRDVLAKVPSLLKSLMLEISKNKEIENKGPGENSSGPQNGGDHGNGIVHGAI
jgi:hypothetical protein